jgi:hypothetical protein
MTVIEPHYQIKNGMCNSVTDIHPLRPYARARTCAWAINPRNSATSVTPNRRTP